MRGEEVGVLEVTVAVENASRTVYFHVEEEYHPGSPPQVLSNGMWWGNSAGVLLPGEGTANHAPL